jgi:acyl-[acyl carrier protein]--UDP-N-acetylglucosamine O-acyltransferase
LRITFLIQLLEGEGEFVCLEEKEKVYQYSRISEHTLCGKLEQLFMDVVSQKLVVVKLCSILFFSGENV